MQPGSITTLGPDELVEAIHDRLEGAAPRSTYSAFSLSPDDAVPPVYTLIVGAGFSVDIVPLVQELMHVTIGDYYYPDQTGESLERPLAVLRKNSAMFWREYNSAASAEGLPIIAVSKDGLPVEPSAAYQALFTYKGANVLFTLDEPRTPSFLDRLRAARGGASPPMAIERGRRFVDGFLRYVIDVGSGAEGSTGRTYLNSAHIYLAALLEVQQLGRRWKDAPFCRTIFTTNFDTLLQNALQLVNLSYCITDRPERGLERTDLPAAESAIHLVYTHGSILRQNPASSVDELSGLAGSNATVLANYLGTRDVIAIGYGGWDDGIMRALRECGSATHALYWCDVRPGPPPHVARLLAEREGRAAYVPLGKEGANGLMHRLYERLTPERDRRDPMERYSAWHQILQNHSPRGAAP